MLWVSFMKFWDKVPPHYTYQTSDKKSHSAHPRLHGTMVNNSNLLHLPVHARTCLLVYNVPISIKCEEDMHSTNLPSAL